jgi:hypothetical protein
MPQQQISMHDRLLQNLPVNSTLITLKAINDKLLKLAADASSASFIFAAVISCLQLTCCTTNSQPAIVPYSASPARLQDIIC